MKTEVIDVKSVDSFKARLDKYWKHQDVVFDYKAELAIGAGENSEYLYF